MSTGDKKHAKPRTRKQQEEAKKQGSILGYFKLPKGRPPKDLRNGSSTTAKCVTASSSMMVNHISAKRHATGTLAPPQKKKRGKYATYPRHILAAVLKSSISGVDLDLDDHDAAIAAAIPQQTLRDYKKRA
jgi:hypothetical protein